MSASRTPAHDSIAARLERAGVSRRHFITFCGKLMVVAPVGLAITNHLTPEVVAAEIGKAKRPSIIWLQMQDCTGCTETLLRTSQPDLADLIFNVISLDYHETVMAASGRDAELALQDAMKQNDGKYLVVVEGAIPTKENGKYLYLAGKPGLQVLNEVTSRAAAVISMGSCSSWGGVASTGENPTGSTGVISLIKNKPIVNLPGCPPNPYVLLGTVLEYARTGKVPALDEQNRPKFAYDRTIHDQCPRRPFFDAGQFATQFGDQGHRSGYCLYKLGCKGPLTHAPCSTRQFNEVVGAWPIGIGHPCVGCTEQGVVFTKSIADTVDIHRPLPPDTYPSIFPAHTGISPTATAVAGLIGGALVGGGIVASRKLNGVDHTDTKE
jgi:hydrogenase small subunit